MKTNYELRYATNPRDAKSYDKARLRQEFLVQKIFTADEINMVYSLYNRVIVGGAFPVSETLELEAIDVLETQYFLNNREIGVFNIGGDGIVEVDSTKYELGYKEALYIGSGNKTVKFSSKDSSKPAKFYFNSTPAHTSYPDKKITKAEAVVSEMGADETSNHRALNYMIVPKVLPTCNLQMGMSEMKVGNVWKGLTPRSHNRTVETYFYFEIPEGDAICHFIGEPDDSRNIWLQGEEAIISPDWSVHAAVGTRNYSFIWGMTGESLDYGDQDFFKYTDLK